MSELDFLSEHDDMGQSPCVALFRVVTQSKWCASAARWLSLHQEEVMHQYAGTYVAVAPTGVVAVGQDWIGLGVALEGMRLPLTEAVCIYVARHDS